MADIKTVISGIIDIQDKSISKLKYNNNAIISISGSVGALSGNVSEISTSIASLSSKLNNNFYNKSQVDEIIGSSTAFNKDDYYDKEETEDRIHTVAISEINDFSENLENLYISKSESVLFLTEEVDPIFAAQSSQFALKSEIGSLIGEELDPKFAEVSGQFATKTDLDEFHTYDNLTYVNKIYQTIDQSKNAVPGFETFIEIPDATTSGEILDLRADDNFFTWIDGGYGKYSYAIRSVSNNTLLNGNVYSLPTNVNNLKNLSIGRDVAFGIAENGDLYVARSRSYRKFSYQYKRWYNVRRNINNFFSIKLDSSS